MPLYRDTHFEDVQAGGVYIISRYGLLSVIDIVDKENGVPWHQDTNIHHFLR